MTEDKKQYTSEIFGADLVLDILRPHLVRLQPLLEKLARGEALSQYDKKDLELCRRAIRNVCEKHSIEDMTQPAAIVEF